MQTVSDNLGKITREKWIGVYLSDSMRHLVCLPYSIENLHRMAEDLGIKRCWFHKDHYDIPKRRMEEIQAKTIEITPREMVQLIREK